MRRFVTSIAAIVLMAGAAHAEGNGNGNKGGGQGGGGGHAAGASMQGGGGGGHGNGNRGGGGGGGQDHGNARGQGGGGGGEARAEHGNSGGKSGERGNGHARVADDRGNGDGHGNRAVVIDDRGRGHGNRGVVIDDRGRGRGDGDVLRVASFRAVPTRGLIGGCPPGLAKKNPPCIPPGQVRGRYVRYDRPDFWGLRLGGGRYRYDDGYLLRFGPDGRIGGYIPLLGGALAIGNVWPTYYEPVALPVYYESYYGLGPYSSYRYADNVIYRIDPETAAITSVAALLTGDDFVVGRPMPIGYDVYNVPYAYRTQYVDSPTANYRYADGYVYQLDPETRLIAAAIELIAS
jgi:hypothetical protein